MARAGLLALDRRSLESVSTLLITGENPLPEAHATWEELKQRIPSFRLLMPVFLGDRDAWAALVPSEALTMTVTADGPLEPDVADALGRMGLLAIIGAQREKIAELQRQIGDPSTTRRYVVSAVIGRHHIDDEDSDEPQSVGRFLSIAHGTYAWVEEPDATLFLHADVAQDALEAYLSTKPEGVIDGSICWFNVERREKEKVS